MTPTPVEIGIPYATPSMWRGRYGVKCPVCGARIEGRDDSQATAEDAATKGAAQEYARHYEEEHRRSPEDRALEAVRAALEVAHEGESLEDVAEIGATDGGVSLELTTGEVVFLDVTKVVAPRFRFRQGRRVHLASKSGPDEVLTACGLPVQVTGAPTGEGRTSAPITCPACLTKVSS